MSLTGFPQAVTIQSWPLFFLIRRSKRRLEHLRGVHSTVNSFNGHNDYSIKACAWSRGVNALLGGLSVNCHLTLLLSGSLLQHTSCLVRKTQQAATPQPRSGESALHKETALFLCSDNRLGCNTMAWKEISASRSCSRARQPWVSIGAQPIESCWKSGFSPAQSTMGSYLPVGEISGFTRKDSRVWTLVCTYS